MILSWIEHLISDGYLWIKEIKVSGELKTLSIDFDLFIAFQNVPHDQIKPDICIVQSLRKNKWLCNKVNDIIEIMLENYCTLRARELFFFVTYSRRLLN
jgi:hypothetical protein